MARPRCSTGRPASAAGEPGQPPPHRRPRQRGAYRGRQQRAAADRLRPRRRADRGWPLHLPADRHRAEVRDAVRPCGGGAHRYRPRLHRRPDDSTTITLLASYQHDPEGGFYNFVPASGTVLANPNGRIPRNFFGGDPAYDKYYRTQAAIGYQLEHRLDDVWTVRQNFRYAHIDAEVNVLSVRSVGADQRTGTRSATFVSDHANAFALDNQAQASFTTGALRHTALFGIDWQRTSARARQGLRSQGVPGIDLFRPVYYQSIPAILTDPSGLTNQNIDQLGFYAQDQVALGRWRFNVGLRYDRASIGTTTHTTTGADAGSLSQFDDALTWRVGGLYLFDNGLAPYASYSTSFLPNTGTQAPQRGGGTFEPTTGEQYEVGVKYQPPA
ncbi:TonB-dependent receptor domain-containing protein [Teichococcus aestuarii]|uniref:TonB-dependent receptor domain-containing protein n=1 Tax=Teichococcus aestuarii TaxID=568898 RepID=UPI00360D4D21